MRIKSQRCGICHAWHRGQSHCHVCGALMLIVNGRQQHYNVQTGRVMARGVPGGLNVIRTHSSSTTLNRLFAQRRAMAQE